MQLQHKHACVLDSSTGTGAGCRRARQGANPAARVLELAVRLVERLKRRPRVCPGVLVLRTQRSISVRRGLVAACSDCTLKPGCLTVQHIPTTRKPSKSKLWTDRKSFGALLCVETETRTPFGDAPGGQGWTAAGRPLTRLRWCRSTRAAPARPHPGMAAPSACTDTDRHELATCKVHFHRKQSRNLF